MRPLRLGAKFVSTNCFSFDQRMATPPLGGQAQRLAGISSMGLRTAPGVAREPAGSGKGDKVGFK
tara:strand:- start:3597 stop:3791 length:195 start_codon:yes stop_codon:yes gene_type:complete